MLWVEPDVKEGVSRSSISGWRIRPTIGGQKALETWRPLTKVIEGRWEKRFGKEVVDRLCESLRFLVNGFDENFPDCLPILGYQLLSGGSEGGRGATTRRDSSADTLPALLAKVLLAFATEFERDSELSLAISANVLRLAGPEGVRIRDLPRLSGVSKEAISMVLGRLEERGFAVVEQETPKSRVNRLALTAKGRQAQEMTHRLMWTIERRWRTRFGEEAITSLRELLERLAGDPGGDPVRESPLFRGLEPYPDGWRASVPKPESLPHYPMVLHRGGFPDGS
jgi:DNA-binding MarR family transcriptional regulator